MYQYSSRKFKAGNLYSGKIRSVNYQKLQALSQRFTSLHYVYHKLATIREEVKECNYFSSVIDIEFGRYISQRNKKDLDIKFNTLFSAVELQYSRYKKVLIHKTTKHQTSI